MSQEQNEPEGFTVITYTPAETISWRPPFDAEMNATWVETWDEVEDLLIRQAAGQNLDDDRALRSYWILSRNVFALDYPSDAFDVSRPSAWVFPGRPRVISQFQKGEIICKAKECRQKWQQEKEKAEAKEVEQEQRERDERDREELERLLKRRENGEI